MARRLFLLLLAALTGALAWGQNASRPVRLIVPWSPGGGADISARIIAPKLGEALGAQVIVDNKPGATGVIGTDLVAKAPPDGNTLILGTNSTFVIAVGLFPRLPYDPLKDLTPITRVAAVPHVLTVHPSVPARNVAELVAYLKANPDKVSFGSSGAGSTPHVAGENFKIASSVNILHVPYKGSGQSVADTIAGNVQVSFDTLPSVIGHIRVNRLRPLAILGPKRVAALPDVPTIGEAGYPTAEGVTWVGLYGPGGMQPAQVNRLFNEMTKVMQLPDVAARFKDFGAAETTSASPDEFSKMVVREIEIYSKVIKQAGITPQQ